MNFASRVVAAAQRFADRVAIERVIALDTGGDRIESTTYAGLLVQAERWSARLAAHRVTRGDRVAILGDNDAPWIAAYLGALRMGAVAVPLDTAYAAHQVRTIVDASGASVLCVSDKYAATAETALAHAPIARLRLESVDDGSPAPAFVETAPDEPAVILFTSGTTADPKGVVLSHANLNAECDAALAVVDCNDDDVVLGVLPLFHALAQMANLLVPFSVGARVVYLQTISSASLLAALQQRGITIFVCVPQFFYLLHQRVMTESAKAGAARRTMFRLLLKTNGWLRERAGWNPGRRWFARVHAALGSRMRLLITGGSRFDPQIGRDLHDLGVTLLNGYGLTETSGAATVQRPRDRYTTSVGQPLPGVDIRIAESGEIQIRGAIVMREYYHRPDATAEAIADGWLHTGDLGYLDDEGRLFITGRQKEVIVLSSGKNIYPEEVEAQYRRSEFVRELCVMGRANPGEPSAERLHAVVVPDEDALRRRGTVNVRELLRFELEEQSVALPPHKRVLTFDVWMSALPRTTTGKLKRAEIQRLVESRVQVSAAASADARPLTDAERAWTSHGRRAESLAVVAKTLQRATVTPDANLELDLGLDSMERVELLAAMEQHAGARVGADARRTIFTVAQLVEAIERAGAGAPGITSAAAPTGTPTAVAASTGAGEPAWPVLLASAGDTDVVRALSRYETMRALLFFVCLRALSAVARLCLRFRVTGREHVRSERAFIITPNHQSYLDALFVCAALPFPVLQRIFFVGAAEYYQSRFAKWAARMCNVVPVDPDQNLIAAMRVSADGLRARRVLVLFPEGERTIDGEVRQFRRGAAILSASLDVPIVPAAIDGLFALWPRRRPFNWRALLPWRGSRASVSFAAPLTASAGDETRGTAELEARVREMVRWMRENGAR